MPKLALTLEASSATYMAGETVRGTVTLRTTTSFATRSLTILVKGREKVQVSFYETADVAAAAITNIISVAAGAHPHSVPKRKKYKERHDVLHHSITLVGAALGFAKGATDTMLLSAGEHSYPFELTLPDALPGSFSHSAHSYMVDLSYSLEVRADAARGPWDETLTRPLTILGNHAAAPSLAPLLAANPLVVDAAKSFLGCQGELSASACLPRRCLILGERVTLRLDVTNGTSVGLASIRVSLVTHCKVTAPPPPGSAVDKKPHTERDETTAVLLCVISTVSKATRLHSLTSPAKDGAKRSAAFTVAVPAAAETSHKSSRLTTFHYVEVELVPKGWLHRSLALRLPVGVFAPVAGLSGPPAVREPAGPAASTEAEEPEDVEASLAAVSDEDVSTALHEMGSGEAGGTTPKGHTALHLACLRGHAGLARGLIAAGCDPSARTQAGFTPLHSAAYAGSAATCLVILEACPAGSILSLVTGKGSTAADLARRDLPPDSPANEDLASMLEEWTPPVGSALEGGPVDGDSDSGEEEEGGGGEERREIEADVEPPDCSDPSIAVAEAAEAAEVAEAAAEAGAAVLPADQVAAADGPAEAPAAETSRPEPRSVPPSPEPPPPSVVVWMPDDASPNCTLCSRAFTFTRRRHHCRRCGKLVCDGCGPKRAGERTCVTCAAG
jgi:hypothetical protein